MLACPVRWLLKASAQRSSVLRPEAGPRTTSCSATWREACRAARLRSRASSAGRFATWTRTRARHRGSRRRRPLRVRARLGSRRRARLCALGVERQTLVDVAVARPSSSTTSPSSSAWSPTSQRRADVRFERSDRSSDRWTSSTSVSGSRTRPAGSERHRVAECVIRLRLEHVHPRARAGERHRARSSRNAEGSLTAEGVMSCTVDLRDHFSFMDGPSRRTTSCASTRGAGASSARRSITRTAFGTRITSRCSGRLGSRWWRSGRSSPRRRISTCCAARPRRALREPLLVEELGVKQLRSVAVSFVHQTLGRALRSAPG